MLNQVQHDEVLYYGPARGYWNRMPAPPHITALIVAAGKGERAGGDIPKQFAPLGGKPMLAWSIDAFASHPLVAGIVVVVGDGQQSFAENIVNHARSAEPVEARLTDPALRQAQGYGTGITIDIIPGGATRADSVRNGLEAIEAGGGTSKILIHDAARPFLTHAVIDRLLNALTTSTGAVPALPSVDTLALGPDTLGDTLDRSQVMRIQTPQAFHFDAICQAHRAYGSPAATDDAQIARSFGLKVALVAGDTALEKITMPEDLTRAKAMLDARRTTRTGMGFDVHRLVIGEELWLCGVKLEHSHGLSGHSDADVALHALTDALLGAAGEGDIGDHFPPSDPQWRGAASHRFASHAAALIRAKGGSIDHVDVTIIAEAPRIGPHRSAMRARVAEMLGLAINQVSVKATTTEGLGLTGRGEGVAAQAVATIRL